MNKRLIIDSGTRLQLGVGVQLRFDQARESWALMAPEKVILLDDIAHAIVNEVLIESNDVAAAIDALATRYGAPKEEITGDTIELLQGFADRQLVRSR